jgi:myo-inositol 2-dehydrogenase / D-chiro-inositol 1-dehydrogenase
MAHDEGQAGCSRRDFLKSATAAAVAGTVVTRASFLGGVHAAGSDEIRVGIIGCGGRGSGAGANVLEAAPGVRIVALGDAFQDRLDRCREILAKQGEAGTVPPERCFVGLDAYQQVIDSDVNYIILASPPAFRPRHLEAAIAAGRHIFTEKPVAVDGPGIRQCLALHEQAKAKGLGIAAGTQRRHQTGYLETMKRIHDGAIGDIVAARCYWNQGGLWKRDRQPGWTDLEWQMRNWLYFTWLSGDHIVEQHVHNLDVVNWAKQAHPVSALGLGGRQVRVGPEWGHIFDHFAVDYEYADGTHMMSMCRQIEGCDKNVSEALAGTKGTCQVDRYHIRGDNPWRFRDEDNNPYVQEHTNLIASLRNGAPFNELKNVTEGTLTAIMGRMSTYTGRVVTWEQALNSLENLVPEQLEFGPMPMPAVPVPGKTELT